MRRRGREAARVGAAGERQLKERSRKGKMRKARSRSSCGWRGYSTFVRVTNWRTLPLTLFTGERIKEEIGKTLCTQMSLPTKPRLSESAGESKAICIIALTILSITF